MSASLWELPEDRRRKLVPYPFDVSVENEGRRAELEAEIANAEGDIRDLTVALTQARKLLEWLRAELRAIP